jgi:hypothetical protein
MDAAASARRESQGGFPVSDSRRAKTNGAWPGEAFWRRRVAAYGKSVWS